MPKEFWISIPEKRHLVKYTSTDKINRLSYITEGCTLLWVHDVPPSSQESRLAISHGFLGTGGQQSFETIGRYVSCEPGNALHVAAEWGGSAAKSFGAKISDGVSTYLDAFWHGMKSDLSFGYDLDGDSEQRDRPRFTRLDGTFTTMNVAAENQETDKAIHAQWYDGAVTADMQGQWYRDGGGGSEAQAHGTFDVPSGMTDKDCLEWNRTPDPDECELWETKSQMKTRVAKTYLTDVITYRDGRGDQIPYEAWAEVVE